MRFGTFLVGLRSYPRVRPHDLGIQIDIISGLLFRQGTLGRWYQEGTQNGPNLVGGGLRAIFGSRWEISTKYDQDLAGNGGAHPLGLLLGPKTIKFGQNKK